LIIQFSIFGLICLGYCCKKMCAISGNSIPATFKIYNIPHPKKIMNLPYRILSDLINCLFELVTSNTDELMAITIGECFCIIWPVWW